MMDTDRVLTIPFKDGLLSLGMTLTTTDGDPDLEIVKDELFGMAIEVTNKHGVSILTGLAEKFGAAGSTPETSRTFSAQLADGVRMEFVLEFRLPDASINTDVAMAMLARTIIPTMLSETAKLWLQLELAKAGDESGYNERAREMAADRMERQLAELFGGMSSGDPEFDMFAGHRATRFND